MTDETDKCPVCSGPMTTYKSTPIDDMVRRLRRCKEKRKCGYKEVIVVRVVEQVLERRAVAG
jgi:hypothetical protein